MKSTVAELKQLREQVFYRDETCVWPGDHHEGPLQLAHLTHRGMGGSVERNTEDNAVALCRGDHDVLDGRAGLQYSICRIRQAYAGSRQAHPFQITHQLSIPPLMDTSFTDGRLAFERTSKPSNTGLSVVMSPWPSKSTTGTTTPEITDQKTSHTSPRHSTNPKLTDLTTTGRPLLADTLRGIPHPNSPNSSVSIHQLYTEALNVEDTHSEPSEKAKRPLPAEELTPTNLWPCTWRGCDVLGLRLNSAQRQRWSEHGCKTSECPDIPLDAHLCDLHTDILLDGRTGLGTLRLELNELMRHVAGISRS